MTTETPNTVPSALVGTVLCFVVVTLVTWATGTLGLSWWGTLASVSDFSVELALAETAFEQDKDTSYHCGRIVFHLNGFLHAIITKRGGLLPTTKAPVASVAPSRARSKKKKTAKKGTKNVSRR